MFFSGKTTSFPIAAGCMLALLGCAAPALAQETALDDRAFEDRATYVSFQVPGCPWTFAYVINNSFSVAGQCGGGPVAPFAFHGFVRDVWGKITLFDPPGSLYTAIEGINAAGAIVGYYQAPPVGDVTGYVRSRLGDITTFDYLGNSTMPSGMNDRGAVTGFYVEGRGSQQGFLRSPEGKMTSFDVPGSTSTLPRSINNEGIITGSYGAGGSEHGFVRDSHGEFTLFDAPGSFGTLPIGIDAEGTIVGVYFDSNAPSPPHGFVRSRQGTITTFDPPGSTNTQPYSINAHGAVAGVYSFSNPELGSTGFVRTRRGKFVVIEYPGVTSGTVAYDINDFGAITGTYGLFGFVRVPVL